MKTKVSLNNFNELCRPVKLYLIISLLILIILFYQNYSNPKKYCVGMFETKSDCNNRFFFVFKILYIVVWTYLLQKLCSKGYFTVSWILVLFPVIIMFLLIGIVMLVLMKKNNQL